MRDNRVLLFSLFLVLIPYVSGAYSLASVNSLLTSYSVPVNLISSLKPVNITFSGNQYVGMYSQGEPAFLINVTKGYSIVLNTTAIYDIIKNYTIGSALVNINFSALNKQMKAYQSSSQGLLNDCYLRTGYTSGLTCTPANYCAACQTVPICARYFNNESINVGGPFLYGSSLGTFGIAVYRFGNQYVWLNNSFNHFYSSAVNISTIDVAQKIAELGTAYRNISNLTNSMGNSSLFEYVGPLDLASICPNYAGSAIAPWYCNAVGICQNLAYNQTILNKMAAVVNNITALPISNNKVLLLATNVSQLETAYVYPLLSKQRLAQLHVMLNLTAPNYTVLVGNVALLLSHVRNVTLLKDLNALRSNYSNVTKNYFTANLVAANITLGKQYDALSAEYKSLNSTYYSVISVAQNNTAKILEVQMAGGGIAQQLSNIAFAELQLNYLVTANNITGLDVLNIQLKSIQSALSGYSTSPFTLTELARSIDAPFVTALASDLGLGYTSAVSLAPILASFVALMVGVIVFALVLFFKFRLQKAHKLVVNQKTAKNWHVVFVVVGILVLLYIVVTYTLVSSANSSAPFSAFQNAYHSSGTLDIALNGSSASTQSCAMKIAAQVNATHRKAVWESFSNGVCKGSNSTSTVDTCLGFYANKHIPVLILTPGSRNSISLYSLYGTVLNVVGNDTIMNSCYASLLVR